MKYDPHNHAGQLQGLVARLESNEYGICKENRKLLLAYHRELIGEGYTASRICKHLYILKMIVKALSYTALFFFILNFVPRLFH